jgi:hypothetical protein
MGYEHFKIGAIQFPLSASLDAADTVLDPPLTALLNYYEFELTRNLLPYWQAYLPTIGLSDYAGAVVAEKISYDPQLYFQQNQYNLPLLALFRVNETKAEKTVSWYFWKVNATLRYILPVMTASQALSMIQFLKAIKSIINDRTEQGYDPAYLDGYGEVAQPIHDAGIARISVTEATYGYLNLETNMVFPILDLSIEFEEREQFAANTFDNLERLDGYVSVAEAGNTNQLEII